MGRKLCLILLILTVVFSAEPSMGGSGEEVNKFIEPTHNGNVIGRVYDAASGEPIKDAKVCIEDMGEFKEGKQNNAKTDQTGKYNCIAEIGRISSKVNIGRALSSGLAGLFSGSAKDTTKRIDISRLNIRVTSDGYKTFESIVPVRKIDAVSFSAEMQPVLMIKTESAEESACTPGWGAAGIVDVILLPSIAEPDSEVSVTIKLKCPKPAITKKTSIEMNSVGFAHKWIKNPVSVDGYTEFSTKYKISKKLKSGTELLSIRLYDCLADIMPGGDFTTALFQVVKTDEEKSAAVLREKAYKLRQDDNNLEALGVLKELCKMPVTSREDFTALASVADTTGDYDTAVASWAKVFELTPEDLRLYIGGMKANSMFLSGKPELVISEFAPIVDSIKEKDRTNWILMTTMTALGQSYLKTGDLQKANDVCKELQNCEASFINILTIIRASKMPTNELTKWEGFLTDSIKFQNDLKLKQLENAVTTEPNKAQALADYGRYLLDNGRYEEALDKLTQASKLDPNISALQADIQHTVSRLLGKQTDNQQDLDTLITAAEARLGQKKESRDFYSWHNYSLLLLRKLYKENSSGINAASPQLDTCKSALISALLCGRPSEKKIASSQYILTGYMGADIVGLEGFAYPEANTDFIILRCIRILAKYPANKLAHSNLAAAFLELDETDLAASAVQACKQLGTNCSDLAYSEALLSLKKGDKEAATAFFKQVLSSNPRHPKANKTLAELYSEKGDFSSALACLAAHNTYYQKLRIPLGW